MIKSQLWTSWAPKSVEIFNRLPPIFINGDSDTYYRSVATLQVRAVVTGFTGFTGFSGFTGFTRVIRVRGVRGR